MTVVAGHFYGLTFDLIVSYRNRTSLTQLFVSRVWERLSEKTPMYG